MRVYRISRPEHVASGLFGIGAAMHPGRWNSAGVHVAYTASSPSLALLELLVHVNLADVPAGFRLLEYDVPGDAIRDLARAHWPEGWDRFPYRDTVRATGDAFIAGTSHLALGVPSAIVPLERNVLVNPRHPRLNEVRLVENLPLSPDPRLFDAIQRT